MFGKYLEKWILMTEKKRTKRITHGLSTAPNITCRGGGCPVFSQVGAYLLHLVFLKQKHNIATLYNLQAEPQTVRKVPPPSTLHLAPHPGCRMISPVLITPPRHHNIHDTVLLKTNRHGDNSTTSRVADSLPRQHYCAQLAINATYSTACRHYLPLYTRK